MENFDNPKTTLHQERNLKTDVKIGIANLASSKHPEGTQDSAFAASDSLSPLKAFGVFDGMGGYKGGAEASSLAQRTLMDRLENGEVDPDLTPDQAEGLIKSALLEAHEAVKNVAVGEFRQMGTTASVGIIWEGKNGERKLVFGNVGDSRIYVRRGEKLVQLTKDDNLAEIGKPNTVTQALGQDRINPRMGQFDLLPGDQIITVSDGIPDALEGDLERVFNDALASGLSPEQAAGMITKKAREFSNSGRKMDDQTTVVVEVGKQENMTETVPSSKIKKEEKKTEYRLGNGTMVKARRSDGRIEDGWFIVGQAENGKILIMNADGQRKTASIEQLDSINPEIKETNSWDQLIFAINQLPEEITGSARPFSREEIISLIKRIEEVKTREEKTVLTNRMTRAHGLRDKVKDLIQLYETRNNLSASKS